MNGRFDIRETPLEGLKCLVRKPLWDARGFLERLFCAEELACLAEGESFVQINRTLTREAGTIRGFHYQLPPHAETKWVTCLRGRVFDVAVDLRTESPTFLQWHGEELGGENGKTMVIPKGFSHGFQTLQEDCEMLYFHSTAYCAEAEFGFNALDPRMAITWPLQVTDQSERDKCLPLLLKDFAGITL
ncbi:MAG: dTDP-4-dehydrorhamnose 3,5-epimerase family protein [Blastochloris sp.]|nr:dTDP-4-dehydrorhamnose 3,5-epimerase family protein [Blastochloris sp.]